MTLENSPLQPPSQLRYSSNKLTVHYLKTAGTHKFNWKSSSYIIYISIPVKPYFKGFCRSLVLVISHAVEYDILVITLVRGEALITKISYECTVI